jgi:signal transduction histidine kinase
VATAGSPSFTGAVVTVVSAFAGQAAIALELAGQRRHAERLSTVDVRDDGVGIPRRGRRSGLRNLSLRAKELHGELSIKAAEGGGTVLEWRVPVSSRS